MEEKKEIKVRLSTFIAVVEFIIILALIVGAFYLINKDNVKVIKSEEDTQGVNNVQTIEDTKKDILTYDEIGGIEFSKYLDKFKDEKDDKSKIVSYKINSCKMVYYYNDEFIFNVNYDVNVEENSNWIAGNGVIDGDWVRGKNVFINLKKINGEYKYNEEVGQMTAWIPDYLYNEKDEKQETEKNIPDKDLYAQGNEYFVFIENGTAYYKHSRKILDSEANDFLKTQKLEEGVGRVKIFSLGTDVSDTVFLILQDGTVKRMSYDSDLKEFDLFKGYEVEDIISAEGNYGPGNGVKYKILLKDGTIKEIVD